MFRHREVRDDGSVVFSNREVKDGGRYSLFTERLGMVGGSI